jgi:hypothetical protein
MEKLIRKSGKEDILGEEWQILTEQSCQVTPEHTVKGHILLQFSV